MILFYTLRARKIIENIKTLKVFWIDQFNADFYQIISKSLIFATDALAYGSYCINIAWNNCLRKIFNACYI